MKKLVAMLPSTINGHLHCLVEYVCENELQSLTFGRINLHHSAL